MNLGRGFPIPPANGVMQNRNVWIPSTPGRPDLYRSNTAQMGMPQIPIGGENWPQIPIGEENWEENWQELMGVYTGVLQGSGNNPSHDLNLNSLASPSHKDHSIQHVAPVEAHNMLQQNNDPTMAFGLHSMGKNGQNVAFQQFDQMGIQDFSTMQKFVSYDHQNARSASSSSLLDFAEVVATPRKVNCLADLVGMPRGTPWRNTNIGVESNSQVAYTSLFVGDELQQTHILHSNGDIGSCNLQEMTNSTHSNRNYNLNLPPRPEASEPTRFLPFPLGPVTPGLQKQSKTYQLSQEPNSMTDGTSTQEKHAQNTVNLSSPLPEIRIRDRSEILLGTPSESVAANGNGGIDLNQTPQQKPARRKKHRPKVIREGKLKQTPKPDAEAKGRTPDDNSKVKRKYVRKNEVNASETPLVNEVNAVEPPNGRPGPAKKSKIRKRKLNFDSENGVKRESHDKGLNYQAQNNEGGYKIPFNLNLDVQNSDWSINLTEPSTSTGNNNVYVHSNNKVTSQDSLAMVNMAPQRNHPLNVIARNINIQNSRTNQSTQEHHGINSSLDTSVIHSNSSLRNSYSTTRQSTVQNMHPQLVDVSEIQGAEMRHPHAITLIGSQLWSKEVSDTGHHNRDSNGLWRNGLDTCGKTNANYKFHGTSSSSTPSGVTTDDDFSGQIGWSKNFQSGEWPNSNIRGCNISRNPNDKSNKFTHDWCMNYPDLRPEFHQQHALSQVHLCSEQVLQPKAYNSFNVVTNWNLGSASQRDPKSIPISGIINCTDRVEVNRRTMIDKRLELEAKSRRNYRNSAKKGSGLQEEKMISVDYITNLLKGLHIWTNKWQSSLVPYKGGDAVVSYTGDGAVVSYEGDGAVVQYKGDGAVVPYKEFDSVKKHRPRPRVDLDPETNRLWNLLMGKEGSESAETMDSDKQKWWEEERKVFRGRVDSFIARMHLIQGDRRFSKWKGSVVDSVIGVYLTQNVSDHLSSSAFMSLAAKFPLKPSTACQPCSKTGGSSSVEHHEVCITYPDGTTYQQKILREPASNHSTVTSTKSSEYKTNNVMKEKNTVLGNNHTNKTEEDIISSQSSSESFVFACEDIRSSSGSNSEGDDVWNIKNLGYIGEQAEGIMGNSHSYQGLLFGHQQLENQGVAAPVSSTVSSDLVVAPVPHNQHSVLQSPNYLPDMSLGLEKWEEDVLAFSANECISALASEEFEVTDGTGVTPTHYYKGQNSESTLAGINGIPKSQPSAVNHEILKKHPEVQTNSRDKSVNRIGQQNFQQESDPTRPVEAFSKQQSGTTHEPAKIGPVNSSEKQSNNIGSTTPNPRKRKAEKEKLEQFDWDILRKQVQSKGGTRERCGENMDSLDYETLRNADVREISDAIKERGMNNMLAERMKSFLNRMVQDHERIDLEWLRDVDPDKAKDYLLSIRGLGLKSVECVRLLTLHHMAFPVDTNVGRIAVRLGWVPLQPLPESLQLHLLELYPVLETIQKYIWPRLCKLDQETLYELHYQMITFGKVFCTKRDPNCNGCPMRGECRHFASAFASARLALPGPEEKRIVTSAAAPVTPNKRPGVIIKPMLLNSSEGNIDGGILGSTRNCEPLIEEPLSPEPPIEVSERDIEDAFYEDPDEIPVIKLDVQEFTTNLQSFMQEHMELGEADLSKALVALSPEFASIPIPKLKHVSRLRTEHQVYELPDSHPLLKGMDRREPDDPSPYLLAIWTPGETADSFQPPESTCRSQEGGCGGGGLCNNKTCFSCNSSREAQAQTVRGTILVPCRTAMRGSFPLNGTYFQVNEVFADHESSLNPIDVPRRLLWNLPRRTVYFGSSVTSIFKGLTTEGIQYCFWKGFVCVRGFDQKSRAPRPLRARLHIPASRAKRNE